MAHGARAGAGGARFDAFWAALDAVPVAEDAEALYSPATPEGLLRRANLVAYLEHVGAAADTVLVAEAPGWRGMTNTGIPFTSMRELGSLGFDVLVPPEPSAPWEASSRVVHAALQDWRGPLPLAWAIFPHHPFVAPDRLTNRTPRPSEVRDGAPVALALLQALQEARGGVDSVRVVAVGRKAQGALALAGIDAVAVRHAAQGGAAQFTEQVRALRS
ncbi:hypothetical protein DEJ23_10035 [Curtobacterium sp. MCSS17_008]|uniref:uracil-DNA glycosylase n=1 Tax=Curtobacterium sp. MCSS17_008 TaxID=2175647 RepID=UPI000DA81C6E|nr:uracil-DNA glycosylase [Curtobacterium sp. MCSS17_008]PZF56498.1 hypothetical protein DEJ23_10035 [Curtobacterium sp. MCSS17_008]